MATVYGVDIEQEITPRMVRDAITQCFVEAHREDTGLPADDPELNQAYCVETVKKAFLDAGASYDHPTRDGIVQALDRLARFSKNFRDSSIIQKHYQQIMTLVHKL